MLLGRIVISIWIITLDDLKQRIRRANSKMETYLNNNIRWFKTISLILRKLGLKNLNNNIRWFKTMH